MALERLLAGAAVAALISGSALAQTGGSTMQPSSASGASSTSSTSAAQPYAAPPTTGGMAEPSAAGNSMGSGSTGAMTGNSMSGGTMSGGSMAGAGMGGSSFTPIRATGGDIIAELTASGEFTKLLAALKDTNLTSLISTHPNLTLFAPTDAAFAALPPGQLDMLMKSPAQLQAILTYHLVATTLKESDIKGHAAGKVPAADKKTLTVDGSGPMIKVNEATVLQSAVPASNGEIYPIDKVLMPPAV